jgi:hypothetical protein
MADTRQRTTWGNRFRSLLRFAGLTGVVAAVFGGILTAATLPRVDFYSWSGWKSLPDLLRAASEGAHGELAKVGAWMVACGGAAVAVALAVEALGAVLLGVGRRTAVGTGATVGVTAAVVLLVLVNVYSGTHYGRYDGTRDARFTLAPELAAELGKLRASAPTTIVVLQKHRMFGTLSEERDSYTKAAEEKVTEKVKDLVDQFREFGPQFHVSVLDTEAFGYKDELDALTRDAPELKTAIEEAPENSIFFHGNKRVQRLSFSEFMQLDRTASREADGGRANLVLLPQGIDRFAGRILTVQERRPKVAVCVVHELLTTAADDPDNRYSLAGLKKSLAAQGFDVVDVVLKKGWQRARSPADLKPAADNREESKLDRLEAEADRADDEVTAAREAVKVLDAVRKAVAEVKDKPWEERRALYQRLTRRVFTEDREPRLLALLEEQARRAAEELKEATEKKKEAERKLAEAFRDERALQDRRMTDVRAKFAKQLADVDLLIVPRVTSENAMRGPGVRASLHALNAEQVKVVKEFMLKGKPVLACLGPVTPQVTPRQGEPADDFDKRLIAEVASAPDEFERLLADRGIELGGTVVLFDGETKALGRGDQFGDRPAEVPPLALSDPAADPALPPNPIAAAMRLTGRTADRALDLRLRAVRPVALFAGWSPRPPFVAEFAYTAADSWTELRPYPIIAEREDGTEVPVYVPKFTATPLSDPTKGTRDEERRGPFPIAVAVESKVPAAWEYDDFAARHVAAQLNPLEAAPALGPLRVAELGDRPIQRTVVIGSGNVFSGAELKPAQEKLLLHSVNWLTGRADRLPRPTGAEAPQWQYPRVEMSDRARVLWRFGTAVGMPLVVAYAGLLAMMRRRTR